MNVQPLVCIDCKYWQSERFNCFWIDIAACVDFGLCINACQRRMVEVAA